jgi:hypothetical protein
MQFPVNDGYEVCVSYRFNCTADDTACSPEEQKNGTSKWAYVPTSTKTCTDMKEMVQFGYYQDLTCCTQDKCNKPDPAKDPFTKIQ